MKYCDPLQQQRSYLEQWEIYMYTEVKPFDLRSIDRTVTISRIGICRSDISEDILLTASPYGLIFEEKFKTVEDAIKALDRMIVLQFRKTIWSGLGDLFYN